MQLLRVAQALTLNQYDDDCAMACIHAAWLSLMTPLDGGVANGKFCTLMDPRKFAYMSVSRLLSFPDYLHSCCLSSLQISWCVSAN
jgi:hypothetical protein